jgi:DNA-binding GntR family transcriptional regulator
MEPAWHPEKPPRSPHPDRQGEGVAAPDGGTPPGQPARRVVLPDSAYERIRDAIIHGDLAPNAQITEEWLAERLGVSRTPLREAVTRLQADGLVYRAPNRRLFVTPVSAREAENVFSVRMALEDLALTEAAPRLTDEVLAELEASLWRMEAAYRSGKEDVAEGGRSFHEVLYQAAGNTIVQEILARLAIRVNRYRYIATGGGTRRQQQALRDHRAILEALRAGDVTAARAALRQHLEGARVEALKVLRAVEGADRPTAARGGEQRLTRVMAR